MQNGIMLCDDHVKEEIKFLASFFSFFLSKSTFWITFFVINDKYFCASTNGSYQTLKNCHMTIML